MAEWGEELQRALSVDAGADDLALSLRTVAGAFTR